MVLAKPRRGVAIVTQNPADRRTLGTDDRIVARVASGKFTDLAETNRVVVAPGDERRPRGRAKRGRVKLRLTQPDLCQPVHGRRGDDAAKSAVDAVALVVGHNQ